MSAQSLIIAGASLATLKDHAGALARPGDQIIWIDEHPNKAGTSTGIYIEDIRELHFAVRAAPPDGETLAVISDAAAMTQQAQNALLKLLEEPRDKLRLILCTKTPELLLDTVRSRCHLTPIGPSGTGTVDLPDATAARIRFMANGSLDETQKLAANAKYFDSRTALFEQAKRFIGSSAYERAAIVAKVATNRAAAMQFIDACLIIYHTLLKTRYSDTMREETDRLLIVYQNLEHNTNAKLQLLHFVIQ